ncbi:hypothetical protein ABTH24_13255, partial [Acinetobacter baumannii]
SDKPGTVHDVDSDTSTSKYLHLTKTRNPTYISRRCCLVLDFLPMIIFSQKCLACQFLIS